MSASESWSTQRAALAVEALRGAGRLRLQVRGASMLPTLWPGDVAEIQACSLTDVRHGEVVLAFQDGRFFLHRLLAHRGPNGFLTRGDSMPGPDPEFSSETFLGRLVRVARADESRSAPGPLRPLSRTLSMMFCHFGPARRLALKLHSQRDKIRADGIHVSRLTSDVCNPEAL